MTKRDVRQEILQGIQAIKKGRLTIREATLEDAPKLMPLLEQLGYKQTLDSMKERLQNYKTQPNHFVFVANLKSDLIGFIAVAAVESFVYQGLMYRVTALAVDQNARRQGIGQRLMQHVEELAKMNNGRLIDLTSGLRRAQDGSHHFYRALGYDNEGHMAKLYLRKEL